jgi:tRNA-Thr(GGU) m(6)t(6)A37 methyltransferase TsaA
MNDEGAGAIELVPVGRVASSLVDPTLAPRQGDEGAPEAWLVFSAAVRDAVAGLEVDTEMLLLTWLDRADRDVLVVHPRGDPSRARQSVFTTRSQDRPNPIGLHRVRILGIDGLRVRVQNLEAVDGTPILDVKPILGDIDER